jgi:hypothetical protein
MTVRGKEPRDLTVEERRELFRRHKASLATATVQVPPVKIGAAWHRLCTDETMTLERIEELPKPVHRDDLRTPHVWVQYMHRDLQEVVVARGWFDFEDFQWYATYRPEYDTPYVREVSPMAWALIDEGEAPWAGTILRDCELS